ncbi:MAG: helix-turn-helix domain-containing protein [bacterium]
MVTKILQEFGLSSNEAKIYEALLELGEAGVSAITNKTSIHRRNVYDAIKRLNEKGFVFSILSDKESVYCPINPDRLVEIMKEKEVKLLNILPTLKEKYQSRKEGQGAYIYRGINGLKNYMREILRLGEDVYFIGGKLIWFDQRIRLFSEQFFKEAKIKGIKFHCIFDIEVRSKGQDILKYYSLPHKFFPKECSTNSALLIFGSYTVMFSGVTLAKMKDDATIFILKDKDLSESFKKWFWFISKKL